MYLSTFSIILPVFIGGLLFRTLTSPLKVLYLFICLTAILETWSSVLHTYGENNMVFFQIHTYIEFVFLSFVYFLVIKSKYVRNYILILSSLFIFWLIYSDIWGGNSGELNTEVRVFESIILISYFVAHVLTVFRNSSSPFMETQPYFILTCGLLLYFLGTLLVYLYYDYLDGEILMYVWAIHSFLNLILNFIYVIAIWRSRKSLDNS